MLRYAITDRMQLGANETTRRTALLACVARWAGLGVDCIQLREKDLPAAELLSLTRDVRAILRAHSSPTKLLLNAPPHLVLEPAAPSDNLIDGLIDGLHLTAGHTIPPTEARQLLAASPAFARRSPLLSISCHTPEEVQRAALGGVDLILFGPIFGKSIPIPGSPLPDTPESAYRIVTPPIGLDALRSACTFAGQTPVLALGGITPANTVLCLQAGAAGIAGIRHFQQPDAMAAAAPRPAPKP
jgi:thiamine-phosphate pyrophosphorylase